MQCPACKQTDLIQIDLTPRVRTMWFNTCRSCEHKWWTDSREGALIELPQVLDELSAA